MTNLTILENLDMTTDEFAYQLTAYEKCGDIDYTKGIIDIVMMPYLEDADDDDIIQYYNEYLETKDYYDDILYYNDEDFFNTYFYNNPMEVARSTFYGDYRYCDDYVRFNGCGNLESLDSWQALKEAKDDTGFKKWMFETDDAFEELRDDDIKEEIISMTLELVRKGY